MKLFNHNKSSHHSMWKIVGGVALAALGVCVIMQFPDLKRYIRISTM